MTEDRKTYVCIECSESTVGCTLITSKEKTLPVMCGPDCQGYMRACKWLPVPDNFR